MKSYLLPHTSTRINLFDTQLKSQRYRALTPKSESGLFSIAAFATVAFSIPEEK